MIACEGGYYFGRRGKGQAVDLEGKVIRKFKGGDIVPLHVQNFIDAVRGRDASLLNAPLEMGHHSTGWANLANIAFHTGKTYSREQLVAANSLAAWPLLIDDMKQQMSPSGIKTAIGFQSGSDSRPKN